MSGIQRLATIGFEVSDIDAWERFAVEVLGLRVGARGADGSVALRIDERAQRIVLAPGDADDLAYLGFETDDDSDLAALVSALRDGGVSVAEAAPEKVSARRVSALWECEDPAGIPIELSCGGALDSEPFESERVGAGFVTGDGGLGHVVVRSVGLDESNGFYRDLLGMRLSDRIVVELAPAVEVDLHFLHANSRHHTVAYGSLPLPKRIHHFMIETREMKDVGLAYERALAAGIPIASMLGQHPNDRMFSFYAATPSGFQVEFGWGGVKVDDADWDSSAIYDRLSLWGHQAPPSVDAG